MTAREELTQRVQTEWEASPVPIDTDDGRRFEFMTIVTAILGFIQMAAGICKLFNPDPVEPVPDPAVEAGSRRTRVGMERELRQSYKDDYGRRGWRDEWRATGDRSLDVALKVGKTCTREELVQLAEEVRSEGRSSVAPQFATAPLPETDAECDAVEATLKAELNEAL